MNLKTPLPIAHTEHKSQEKVYTKSWAHGDKVVEEAAARSDMSISAEKNSSVPPAFKATESIHVNGIAAIGPFTPGK